MHQPHAVHEVAEAAWSALGPAVLTRPSGTTADSLRALARAARAQKNSRLVLSRFVDSVLPVFVRVSQTLRSEQDTELLPLLEEALQAGLFAPAVAAGHVAAVEALATPEPREPGKRQRTDGGGSSAPVKGEPSNAFSPQSLLYSSVCERVRAGTRTRLRCLDGALTLRCRRHLLHVSSPLAPLLRCDAARRQCKPAVWSRTSQLFAPLRASHQPGGGHGWLLRPRRLRGMGLHRCSLLRSPACCPPLGRASTRVELA